MNDQRIVDILTCGGVGVLPTDTLYGLVAQAKNQKAVGRLNRLKFRSNTKPYIILISDIQQLQDFGVKLTEEMAGILGSYWPGPVSVILHTPHENLEFLHRGHKTLAFRLPNDDDLLEIISKTGPLVAPSANPQGKPPATNIQNAKEYFGGLVDFYIDGGEISGKPSTIISLVDSEPKIIRN